MRRSRTFRRPRTSKYGAIRTEVDGFIFASAAEARRYSELKLLEAAGEITNLVLQPKFNLVVNGTHVCTYIADFQYWDKTAEKTVTEDTKGMKTPAYKIKKKLMKAVFDIDILETK